MAKTFLQGGILAATANDWKKIRAGEYENTATGWKVMRQGFKTWAIRSDSNGVVEFHNTMRFAKLRAAILAATAPKNKSAAKKAPSKSKRSKDNERPEMKESKQRSIYDDWQPAW